MPHRCFVSCCAEACAVYGIETEMSLRCCLQISGIGVMLGKPSLGKACLGGSPVYVCICHRVPERDVQSCIAAGARNEEAVGEACDAGTGCGSCLDRITDMLESHFGAAALSLES